MDKSSFLAYTKNTKTQQQVTHDPIHPRFFIFFVRRIGMSVFIKDIPFFPKGGLDGKPTSKFPSKSAEMVHLLTKLAPGKCIEVTRQTDDPKEFERKRAHWITTARRAKIKVATKIMPNEVGDTVLRIWRMS